MRSQSVGRPHNTIAPATTPILAIDLPVNVTTWLPNFALCERRLMGLSGGRAFLPDASDISGLHSSVEIARCFPGIDHSPFAIQLENERLT